MKVVVCSALIVFVVAGILEAALPPANNLPGGYHDKDVTDADVREMAAFAAQKIGHELVEILAAQMQVVAGFNYRMELALKNGNSLQTCTVVVYSGLMNSGKELTEMQCVL